MNTHRESEALESVSASGVGPSSQPREDARVSERSFLAFGPSDRRTLGLALTMTAVLGIVALAYQPSSDAGFLWDDHTLVERPAPYQTASLVELLTAPFWPEAPLSDVVSRYYRPTTLLSFRFDGLLGGTPEDFHRTNLFTHLFGCVLLALTGWRLGARGGASLAAALVWGLHPRLTESVAWISGRTDVLATAFGLLAFVVCPDLDRTRSGSSISRVTRIARSALAAMCLFCALGSKEVALAFVAALAVAIYRRRAEALRSHADRVRATMTVAVPVVAYATLRTIALAGPLGPSTALAFGDRILTSLEALGRYAAMIVSPLSPQTSVGLVGEADLRYALVGGLVLAALVAAAARKRRHLLEAAAVAPLVLTLSALAPVLHVVPLSLAGSVVADRLLYIPLAGVALALAVASRRLGPRWAAVAGALVVVAAVGETVRTRTRAAEYADEVLFWTIAAEHAHPHNTMARNTLAGIVRDSGDTPLACRLYERSTAVLAAHHHAASTDRRTRENLATCWSRIGRYAESLALAETLAREYPQNGRVHMGLGFTRLHTRDVAGARAAFARAIELDRRLIPFAAPTAQSLDKIERLGSGFVEPPPRREEFFAYGTFLNSIGRLPEANRVFAQIALDRTSLPRQRSQALAHVVSYGPVEIAREALRSCAESPEVALDDGWARLSKRESVQATLLRHIVRIQALAS